MNELPSNDKDDEQLDDDDRNTTTTIIYNPGIADRLEKDISCFESYRFQFKRHHQEEQTEDDDEEEDGSTKFGTFTSIQTKQRPIACFHTHVC